MADRAVAKVCPFWVSVPVEVYEAWPDGSATDKEVLISGICPKCQKETFEENEQG